VVSCYTDLPVRSIWSYWVCRADEHRGGCSLGMGTGNGASLLKGCLLTRFSRCIIGMSVLFPSPATHPPAVRIDRDSRCFGSSRQLSAALFCIWSAFLTTLVVAVCRAGLMLLTMHALPESVHSIVLGSANPPKESRYESGAFSRR
jgi:hypothetical protein